VLRPRDGHPSWDGGRVGATLRSEPLTGDPGGLLDLDATVEAFVAKSGNLAVDDLRVLARDRQTRNYVIFVDHSGSMVGRKLELGATLAAVLAQLSAAGRADYGVLAFDDHLQELKPLGEEREVEQVIDRILRLPEGRATDLGKVLRTAAELSERLPEATDVVLISDCMPTRGVTTFQGLASLARQVPSLYICFTDERDSAIHMFHGGRQMDLYQWWARRWAGDERFEEVGDVEQVDRLVGLLGREPRHGDL
jgi:Mg-chelatase subunit ChlD